MAFITLLTIPLAVWFCCWFALHIIYLSGIPATLETRQDRSLDYVLARRMTRISAAKIICIHYKLIKSQSPHKRLISEVNCCSYVISFVSLTPSLVDRYGSSFVFVQSKRRLLHKRFTRRECFCYVIQRQTTFSLHNNPPISGKLQITLS